MFMTDRNPVDLHQLAADVRRLCDRQDILDCINAYGRVLDRLDGDLIGGAYHADAIDNHGPFVGHIPEFVQFALDIESSFSGTHHGITNHNCEIDGAVAHAESYVYWFVKLADGETLAAGGGRYIDRLERRDGRWKIALRRLLMDWTFKLPADAWLGVEWDAMAGGRDRSDPSYQRPLQLPPELCAILAAKGDRNA
jgi:hypothetical protein